MKPTNVVITGCPGLLASYLTESLIHSQGRVRCVLSAPAFVEFVALFEATASRVARTAARVAERLIRIEPDEMPSGAAVWHFEPAFGGNPGNPGEPGFERLLPALRKARVSECNRVATPYAGCAGWHWLVAHPDVPAFTGFDDLGEFAVCRRFQTSLTIGPSAPGQSGREGFLHFLGTLFDLKTEIEERLPDYFEHRALRCYAPEGASVNLIPVDRAARLILAIAERTDGGCYTIASPESENFAALLDRVSAVWGTSLLPESDADCLNAIDGLFRARLMDFERHLAAPETEIAARGWTASGLTRDLSNSGEEQDVLFDAIFREWSVERAAFAARTAALPGSLIRKDAAQDDGPLVYYSSGPGERTIVLLNALGQGLDYWFRLIDRLRGRARVLIWTPRGLEAASKPFTIADHARDLERILQEEGVQRCHLVAWCTGPKLAVEHCLRHPDSVASMVFLNTTLKCLGGPAEMDTAYECNIEPLCRILDARPSMASSIMSSLGSSVGSDDIDLPAAGEADVSAAVLATMNAALKRHVLHPFATPAAVVAYARQAIDFWKIDMRETARGVAVPVLCVSSEYDRVAAPEASASAAGLLPAGRSIHIPGATHYFLYDCPEVASRLIEAFFDAPDRFASGREDAHRESALHVEAREQGAPVPA